MGTLFNALPGEEVSSGKDMTIKRYGSASIFVSEYDEVYCYLGILQRDASWTLTHEFSWPYYLDGRHSTDKAVQNQVRGYIRLEDGCILLDDYYIDNNDRYFKRVKAGIHFPTQSDGYYGVLVDGEENVALTRATFGFTYKEISVLLECYARAFGWREGYKQYPRLTRSGKNSNTCDINDIWIPKCFPYIMFDRADSGFSHVSLWGFYRHVQLLTLKDSNSAFSRALLNVGLEPALLKRLFCIGKKINTEQAVTRRCFSDD